MLSPDESDVGSARKTLGLAGGDIEVDADIGDVIWYIGDVERRRGVQ